MDKNPSNKATFDKIAKDYQDSKLLPFRIFIERHSLFELLGEVKGKTILDLACGEGVYARKIKEKGALKVVGMDLSSEMIQLARMEEDRFAQGIEYRVGDAGLTQRIGEFDCVCAAYLLNYAKTKDQLFQFCRNIFLNLRPGGRLVGINDNPANLSENYPLYRKYGFIKSSSSRKEGAPITYILYNKDGSTFQFENFYLEPRTYEDVFREAGFKNFTWHKVQLSDEGRQAFEEGYWDDFLADPPLVCFTAEKGAL